ncbi:vitamin K-dependent protein C-like, partial [Copidosoma floridanum]|uniref:vitamin K-dependent protein C-like n=1 Tax=Copidosoma floridanum TaxID=29053 RepID=UPI0006C97EFA
NKDSSVEALEERFPFLVIVKVTTFSNEKYWCNGVIIKEDCVLTSANCVSGAFRLASKVTLSSLSLEGSDKNGRTISFHDIYLHPNYDPVTGENDLAIVRLNETVSSEKLIGIVSEVTNTQKNCDVGSPLLVGYHRIHKGLNIMDSFDVHIMSESQDNNNCEQMLHETQLDVVLRDSELCITNDEGKQVYITDILVQKQCGKYMLIGLVTHNKIVTRAGYYMNWINRWIKPISTITSF